MDGSKRRVTFDDDENVKNENTSTVESEQVEEDMDNEEDDEETEPTVCFIGFKMIE